MKELRLAVSEALWDELCAALNDPRESAGLISAGWAEAAERFTLCLNRVSWVDPGDYEERSARHLKIRSEGWMPALGEAARGDWQPVFFHTHPGAAPHPSRHDETVESQLAPTFGARAGRPYASLILGGSPEAPSFTATIDGRQVEAARITGDRLRFVSAADHEGRAAVGEEVFDRQVRAFGRDGQRHLAGLRAGVVGAGGTGSAVAEQLIRLGVGKVVLVDDDEVSDTNLTRIHESGAADVGDPKVAVIARAAERIGLGNEVIPVEGKITRQGPFEALLGCDVVFGCSDDNAGRAILSRLAYYYLVPVIDVGVLIGSRDGLITAIEARVTTMVPGAPCLFCRGRIDPRRMREEMQSDEELGRLAGEGYAAGLGEPDPAVIAYTTMIASLAVDELLGRLFGYAAELPASETLIQIPPRVFRRLGGRPLAGHFCDRPNLLGRADRVPPLDLAWP